MRLLEKSKDPVVNVALDTIGQKKQALVFVNTKRSAEKVAEDISRKSPINTEAVTNLAERVLKVLSSPTQQCERLATCVKRGIAFHHAGLHQKQKELVEDAFRDGTIKIIGCTPTLAAGLDLPAFRSVIRDVKRYGNHGMQPIPVLEFLQMAGRAGRPKYDKVGEVIVISNTESERDHVIDHYLNGEPEDIVSKLAVEPVLRTYVLSLIATRIIRTKESIYDFFSRTFWAFQYEDTGRIESIIDRMLDLLEEWGFLQQTKEGYRATLIGKRVAELYIDPLTAFNMINGLETAGRKMLKSLTWLHLVANTLEMRPLLRVKQKEYDEVQEKLAYTEPYLLQREPSMFEPEYEDWLNSFKTALLLDAWIEEKDEQWMLQQFDSRPGETRVKIQTADWLLYATHELARLLNMQPLLKEITKMRMRLRYGVKEELLPLVRLEGIGRARARKLHRAGIKDVGGLKKAPYEQLQMMLGAKVAEKIKKQVT